VIFSFALAFGIVGEIIWEPLKDKSASPWEPRKWVSPKKAYKVAAWVVLIGILGELAGESGVFVSSEHLQAIDEATIAQLNNDTAKLRADTTLKEERLDQGAWLLGNIFLPRRVAADTLGREFATLKQFAGTKTLVITVPDLESARLAVDIARVLQLAGWDEALNDGKVVVLDIAQAYSVIGVHVSTDARPQQSPQRMSGLKDAAWKLLIYLRFGYLTDLGINSTGGIPTDVDFVSTRVKYRPDWWPNGFSPPSDTICIFVGRKDFREALSDKEWLDRLPEKTRKFFLSRQIPWSQ
jgi:hypothetical protein